MDKIILVRFGEIALKGLNRGTFEDKLLSNIRRSVSSVGKTNIIKSQARIIIEPVNGNEYNFKEAVSKLIKIFGIVSVSIAYKIEKDIDTIKASAKSLVEEQMQSRSYKTFKVESKRGDKTYPLTSMELSVEVGGFIYETFAPIEVDVHNPELTVYIEIREKYAYIYTEKIKAFGGMPIGSNGKAMLLLSGGIDSPVAGFMIGKRGVEIEAVHFYSYPYTSERAREKVIDLAKIMTGFCGRIKLHIVPFTEIQLAMNERCPEDMLTIIMRRYMMRIAEAIALKNSCHCLVTGESIGQVASQTMQSLCMTDAVANIPVFRPLIGMDKDEVIEIARRIETFETSILPYEDCCTVFVAKHPKTKPNIHDVNSSEEALGDISELVTKAINKTELLVLNI